MTGTVAAIAVAPAVGSPIDMVQSVQAKAARGLEGDRYCAPSAPVDGVHAPETEITLIEIEEIGTFNHAHGTSLAPGDFRRNIVTSGIRLNDLVSVEFNVGEARLRGLELCEPCTTLAAITDARVLRAMAHRAGLRAEIVRSGEIRVGDTISVP